MKKIYTNNEKLIYWKKRLEEVENRANWIALRIAQLEELPGDEYTDQDWSGKLQEQLDRKRKA